MSDGIPRGTVIAANKLPGHDPKLERRAGAVNALQDAVDKLHRLAADKRGADELHAHISQLIDDFAKWRV